MTSKSNKNIPLLELLERPQSAEVASQEAAQDAFIRAKMEEASKLVTPDCVFVVESLESYLALKPGDGRPIVHSFVTETWVNFLRGGNKRADGTINPGMLGSYGNSLDIRDVVGFLRWFIADINAFLVHLGPDRIMAEVAGQIKKAEASIDWTGFPGPKWMYDAEAYFKLQEDWKQLPFGLVVEDDPADNEDPTLWMTPEQGREALGIPEAVVPPFPLKEEEIVDNALEDL